MTMVSRLILVALVAQLASLASLAGECMGAKSGSLRERDPTRDSAFGLAKRDDAPTYHELSGTWVSGKANAGTSGTASGGGGGGGGGRRENGGWNGGNSGIFTGGLTPGSIAGPKTDKDPVPHFIYPIRSDDSIWASWCQGGPKPRYACFHRAYGEYYEYYIDLKYDPYTVFSWGKNYFGVECLPDQDVVIQTKFSVTLTVRLNPDGTRCDIHTAVADASRTSGNSFDDTGNNFEFPDKSLIDSIPKRQD